MCARSSAERSINIRFGPKAAQPPTSPTAACSTVDKVSRRYHRHEAQKSGHNFGSHPKAGDKRRLEQVCRFATDVGEAIGSDAFDGSD